MKNVALSILLIMAIAVPVLSQEKKEAKDSKASTVYTRMVLEDFETSHYSDANIKYNVTTTQKGGLSVRDQFPSPAKDSKKYLGLKIFGRAGDVVQITPAKKLIIDKYCQSISMWVYGKDISGEVSIMLLDSDGASHRMILGRLNFMGWRELTVNIPKTVAQMDRYLSQKKQIEITKIMYNPGNTGALSWNYVYFDDITASVREKFYDKQSDEW